VRRTLAVDAIKSEQSGKSIGGALRLVGVGGDHPGRIRIEKVQRETLHAQHVVGELIGLSETALTSSGAPATADGFSVAAWWIALLSNVLAMGSAGNGLSDLTALEMSSISPEIELEFRIPQDTGHDSDDIQLRNDKDQL